MSMDEFRDLEVFDPIGLKRVLDAVESDMFMARPSGATLDGGVVRISSVSEAIALMVNECDYSEPEARVHAYLPDLLPEIINNCRYALDQDFAFSALVKAANLQDQFGSVILSEVRKRLSTEVWAPVLEASSGTSPQSTHSIILNEVENSIVNLWKYTYFGKIDESPMMNATLRLIEQGTFCCGWLGDGDDLTVVESHICALDYEPGG